MDERGSQEVAESKGRAGSRPISPRPLTLADLLILIAAAGVALLVLRVQLREDRREFAPGVTVAMFEPWGVFQICVTRSLPFLGMAGPALLVLRLRRPRPSRWRVFRQPGTAACLALTVSGSLAVLGDAVLVIASPAFGNTVTYCLLGLGRTGGSVLVVWLSLALAGAWRPVPDWIDRSGRALGILLIILYFLSICRIGC
jgi:hypothetical protein